MGSYEYGAPVGGPSGRWSSTNFIGCLEWSGAINRRLKGYKTNSKRLSFEQNYNYE